MDYFASYGDDAEEQSAENAAAAEEKTRSAAPAAAAAAAASPPVPAAPAGAVAPPSPAAAVSPVAAADSKAAAAALPQLLPALNCAPHVNAFAAAALGAGKAAASGAVYIHPENRLLMTNPKAAVLHAAIQGPLTPQQERQGGWFGVYRHRLGGEVEREHVNVAAFEKEYRSYQHHGRAADPSNFSVQQLLRSSAVTAAGKGRSGGRRAEAGAAAAAAEEEEEEEAEGGGSETRVAVANDRSGFLEESKKQQQKRKRLRNDDAASEDFQGPWAPFVWETAAEGERGGENAAAEAAREREEKEGDSSSFSSSSASSSSPPSSSSSATSASSSSSGSSSSSEKKTESIFHGGGEVDYQGRSWMCVPAGWHSDFEGAAAAAAGGGGVGGVGGDGGSCYPPKREIYSFSGHTGGVQAIRFFPTTGHLLLSGSMDSTVKIWETEGKRRLRRTYTAHDHAVRDVQWASGGGGEKFYSCSYDCTVKLWDTERGAVIGSFGNGKTCYCVSVSPQNENVFIVGSANRRAVQFDARTGQIEVEYAEHIGSVNTVTFCEEGKRIVTTADDKKLFVWEFGIPVVIKHVSEPHMHSMPAAAKHPSERYVAFQSMDNQIVVFEAHGKYRPSPRKHFKGHVCAGYACHPCFSPDGRWLLSGDGSGKLWVWNWKKGKNTRSLQAHEQVCIDCQWHPARTSRVATCGWDGLIKLWD